MILERLDRMMSLLEGLSDEVRGLRSDVESMRKGALQDEVNRQQVEGLGRRLTEVESRVGALEHVGGP